MYRLFAAAQAMAFSVGCHARCSNLVVESNPFASTTGLSAPAFHTQRKHNYAYSKGTSLEKCVNSMFKINRLNTKLWTICKRTKYIIKKLLNCFSFYQQTKLEQICKHHIPTLFPLDLTHLVNKYKTRLI